MKKPAFCFLFVLFCAIPFAQQMPLHKNFSVAVYTRAYEVREMTDEKKLEETWKKLSGQLKIDKIYLETHRDQIIVPEKTLETAIRFFTSKGIKVAGGITFTINESNNFETFCYTNPEQRQKVKEIAEYTAKHFDEFILDDFFFTSCKCDLCIQAKGDRSWTDFRLQLMTEAAKDLVIGPAKAVNPNVKIVIKYPNWYEHFQGLGFNLETEPGMFDGIHTGTETRDAVYSDQHLQQYESYLIIRYFDNIAPGRNGGGWVDPFASFYTDRYAEQLWLTLFAKAPEITLFDYGSIQNAVSKESRAKWQGTGTSFDYDAMMSIAPSLNGNPVMMAHAADATFDMVDKFLGELGTPFGIKSYRPYHATGEDFLQNYIGMIGIPMDITPSFPTDGNMILLTESAKFDPDIVKKIRTRLESGKDVMITSGLLKALQDKGIGQIAEIYCTDRKVSVSEFKTGWMPCKAEREIIMPVITYLTNDSWEQISAIKGASGWPLLHRASYSNANLYILTIPDNFSDLYQLPPQVLNRLRQVLSKDLPVRIEGPSQVSLFCYDNGTFIVESFLPDPVTIKIIARDPVKSLTDLQTKESLTGTAVKPEPRIKTEPAIAFEMTLKPHSFSVFKTN
jgi:hypothetical protein